MISLLPSTSTVSRADASKDDEANLVLVSSIKLENPYAPTKILEKDLRLPDLESFHFGPLEDLESLDDSNISEPENGNPIGLEDIWKIAFDLGPANKDVKLYSWEAFRDPKHEDPRSAYISEAGPSIFDALQARESPVKAHVTKPLGTNVLLRSLYQAALGRSSVLFTFNRITGTFQSSLQDVLASGCTLELSQSITDYFTSSGILVWRLTEFSDRVIANGSRISTKVALAKAIRSVLSATEEYLSPALSSLQSVLQLQGLFARPRVLLRLMQDTIEYTEDSKSNEDLLSKVFQKVGHVVESGSWLSDCMFSIFQHVGHPWLCDVERWIGLRQGLPINDFEPRNLPGFIGLGEIQSMETGEGTQSDHMYKEEKRPHFLAAEEARAIFETGKAFRVLQMQHPDHPLCTVRKQAASSQHFRWTSEFGDVQRIVDKAQAYELKLKTAIRRFDSRVPSDTAHGTTKVGFENDEGLAWVDSDAQSCWFYRSMAIFDAPPQKQFQDLPDTLQEIVHKALTPESQDPGPLDPVMKAIPLILIPSLSLNPLLYTQAHLVHATTLRLLFHSHRLRSHLSILNDYQLLGNASFLVRLTNALFSFNLASAERRRGKPRIGEMMGLQLGNRATWPPASSELRLVLMGILSESYNSPEIDRGVGSSKPYESKDRNLPGGLSFSVRQLSEDEIEKCTQPDSLHALDFLRLQYTPPRPLDVIITPNCLQRYDTIFKFLLRVVRMQWVVDQQCNPFISAADRQMRNGPHQAHSNLVTRFRFEANHFVSTITSHFLNIGVSAQWHRFDTYIAGLERLLCNADYLDHSKVSELSIPAVRDAHEMMLNQIMTALFLRKRQARVMHALEEVFDAILKFASIQQAERKYPELDRVRRLYANFRSNVRGFLDASRRANGKEGGKVKVPTTGIELDEEGDAIQVNLCMNAYYDRFD